MALQRISSFMSGTVTMCIAAIVSVTSSTCDTFGELFRHTYAVCSGFVEFAVKWVARKVRNVLLAQFGVEVTQRPLVAIVSAKAHLLRMAQRRAPRVEAGWRLCTSI